MTTEPDYTLTIIEQDGGFVVCEGGEPISKMIPDEAAAEAFARRWECWHQPICCGCGSAITRPDDPWDAYSVSSMGPDWMHKSCLQKVLHFEKHGS